ncbi:MAG: isoaspartyl peptidase/L-asparaginase [Betaproteobacteria bacterium]|nr:isoaspartyl peptidase/L-asparaginase [Betaproteobacteria bacterium]
MSIALIVHGGAGTWRPGSDADALAGIRRAVKAGRDILERQGSALDAACAAAVVLEDESVFNAGTGAVLNFDGFVEFDACVMTSHDKGIGAVSGLQRVQNPILVARQVMEMTDHVMLTGDGATRFARVMGHPDYDPVTPARLADWQDKKQKLAFGIGRDPQASMKIRAFLQSHPEYAGGTIGAVALDAQGHLCAATSTGGVTMKLVGRVGDTPLPGCGTYASIDAAVSATGTGEYVVRSFAGREIADRVARGVALDTAMNAVLDQMQADFNADVGFIALDRHGRTVAAHRTAHMPHGWFRNDGLTEARMQA